MEFLDALKLPFQAIGAARSLSRDPFYFDKYNQEQALLQQEAQNKEQMRSGLAGLLQGQADKSGIIWNDTLTPQQKYTNSLVQLAMADPKYAAVAADSANPLSQLDELTKRAELANKESEQKLKNFRINQTLQQYGFGGQSQPSEQPLKSSPLSVRNNNFGNLRNPQTGDFQQYATPEEGKSAMLRDLALKLSGKSPVMQSKYGQGYTPTIENVVSTWAPPSENDTQNYINFVSKQTGLTPNQPLLPADVERIAPAIAQMEGGQQGAQAYQSAQAPKFDQTEFDLAMNKAISGKTEDIKAYADYMDKQRQRPIDQQKTLTEGESSLRKEFEGLPDVRAYRDVESSYERMVKATGQNTGASDIALIFNYMKMLDPGSTVREGEFATAQNSGGIPSYVQSLYNQAVDGQRLTPDQRANFMNQATAQYQGATELFSKRADQYTNLASQYGYDPMRIVQGPRGKAKEMKTPKDVKIDQSIINLKQRGYSDDQISEYKKLRGIK